MAETAKRPGENNERENAESRDRSRFQTVVDQTADAAKQATDKGADTAKRVADTTADATRRTAEAASNVGEKVVGAVKSTTDTAADATRRTAQTAAETTGRAAEQAREATISGLRALAGVQGPLTDAGLEQSRRAFETSSRMTEVYRQAAERAAGDVQALLNSWMSLGRGLQEWQQAYFDALRRNVESFARKREDLSRSSSPIQFAEIQRDLYVDLVSNTLKASTTLLQLSGQIAQEAVRPLQERAHVRVS
jgi:hypothetical protein